jgi:hypothetical protein
MSDDEVRVSGWYGRRSGDPGTIHCTSNGWRDAIWRRDSRGRWYEAEATMRRVVSVDGIGNVTLGEAR